MNLGYFRLQVKNKVNEIKLGFMNDCARAKYQCHLPYLSSNTAIMQK